MPIYEYRCEACGAHEEKLQGLSAPTEHDCPDCGAATGMRRQVSKAAFALAGGGWYAQGYGPGSAPKAGGEGAGGGEAKGGSEAKTEAPKPAAGCGGGCACH